MSDRADAIWALIKPKLNAGWKDREDIQNEIVALETDLMQHATASAESKALREVLEAMVAEYCDYMIRNKLGDPETQHNIKWARTVLGGKHTAPRPWQTCGRIKCARRLSCQFTPCTTGHAVGYLPEHTSNCAFNLPGTAPCDCGASYRRHAVGNLDATPRTDATLKAFAGEADLLLVVGVLETLCRTLERENSQDSVRAAAERMVQTYRDWLAGCANETRWKEVEAAHINLRDALAKPPQTIPAQVRVEEPKA